MSDDEQQPQPAETKDTIKYLITDDKGDFVIEVPATGWKLTFGYVNPAIRDGGMRQAHCVRVWEGEKLRAVFGNCHGLRDLSIPLARKIEKQTGSASWTMDSAGNFERNSKVDVDQQFVLEGGADDSPF